MALNAETISMCYHEAAHTICGLYNFMDVYHIYVMSDKYNQGNTLYEVYNPDNIKNKLLAKILLIYEVQTLYAGLVGERIYYKDISGSDDFPMHLRIGCSRDIRDAASIIHRYDLAKPGKQRYLFKKQVQSDTHNILVHYWRDIKLISHALFKFKELKAGKLKFILTNKSVNKDFWRARFKEIKTLYDGKIELDEKYLKEVLLQNSVVII